MNNDKIPLNESNFFNRELSWLEFNQRVLEQACNRSNAILDRVKFLAITASNLDEFFMVRVGSLKYALQQGQSATDPAGISGREQLRRIRERVIEFNADQERCLLETIDPELEQHGILRLIPEKLNDDQRQFLKRTFHEKIKPVLSTVAVDSPDAAPVLKGARLCICIRLQTSSRNKMWPDRNGKDRSERYVIIPLQSGLERMITIPDESRTSYIYVEDLVGMFLSEWFPNESIEEWTTFRVTRNADLELDDDADDFLSEMQDLIGKRDMSQCIRLRVAQSTSRDMLGFLTQLFNISPEDVYVANGPLDLSSLMQIAQLAGYDDLAGEHWPIYPVEGLTGAEDIFAEIAKRDVVVFHPYQSFDPVVQLIDQAATDPKVIAIKQTLYRTSRNSSIVRALAKAAQNGKHVTVVFELKARFDEARNMNWTAYLERAGVDVVYGISGYKVHAKMTIVVRKEANGIRRYMHFGTGNYNESTAAIYSDISLFTADPQMGVDAVHVFNAITGASMPQDLDLLRMAPIDLRSTILDLIEQETQSAIDGRKAVIMAKFNSLVDPTMIQSLYRASRAGVKIKLNIRGICCLRPGIKGLSENIEVVSVIDRYLEHSRVLYFHNNGDQRIFITSADWMGRNLDRRIELLVPVEDRDCRQQILDVLRLYFSGNENVWDILSDGKHRLRRPHGAESHAPQKEIQQWVAERHAAQTHAGTNLFKAIHRKA